MADDSLLRLSRPASPTFISNNQSFMWNPTTSLQTQEEASLSSVRVSRYSTRYGDHDAGASEALIPPSTLLPSHTLLPSPTLLPYPSTSTSPEYKLPSTNNLDRLPSPPTEDTESDSPRLRIPRPPNAFMLFRSSCIKKIRAQAKERGGEKRQQVFSRVAGEAWHLLKPEERAEWQEKAAATLQEHQRKYPNYKFTPSPRGSARKGRGRAGDEKNESVQEIRAKYLNLPGAAVQVPVTRRRPRKAHSPNDSYTSPSSSYASPSSSQTSSPVLSYPVFTYPFSQNSSPMSLSDSTYSGSGPTSPQSSIPPNAYPSFASAMDTSSDVFGPPQLDSNLPSLFPNPSVPHYLEQQRPDPCMTQQMTMFHQHGLGLQQRRPSTSLGFISHRTPQSGSPMLVSQDPIPRPASACNLRPSVPIAQPVPGYVMNSDMNMMTFPSENDFVSHQAQNQHSAYFTGNAFADDYGFQHFNYEEMAIAYSPDDFKYAGVEGSTLTMD